MLEDRPATSGTDPLERFTRRRFRCHRCGASGPESRDTDRGPGRARYRLDTDTVLIPICPRCCDPAADPAAAVAGMVRGVESGDPDGVDRAPLPVYRCSDPSCQRLWHHTGEALPLPPVRDDRRPGVVGWHPCPWCVEHGPTIATLTHRIRARACPA